MKLFENYKKSLKATETEDWLDLRVVRPFSYLLALMFAKTGIHPNTVTIISMFVGVASCWGYFHGSFYYEGNEGLVYNIIACVLLFIADILDCSDGQLARLTGKTSKWGRILDGLSGFVWFTPIYISIVLRFFYHHSLEFGWLGIEDNLQNSIIATLLVFALALYSGFVGMAGQARIADYYIQIHLFMLKGAKGSELDTVEAQRQAYEDLPKDAHPIIRLFQKSYITYTQKQEKITPQFQALMHKIQEKYGDAANMPADIRQRMLDNSRAAMPWNAMLTFNFRSLMFFTFCLLDLPVENFIFEIIALGLLSRWMISRHENTCKQIMNDIK